MNNHIFIQLYYIINTREEDFKKHLKALAKPRFHPRADPFTRVTFEASKGTPLIKFHLDLSLSFKPLGGNAARHETAAMLMSKVCFLPRLAG